MTYTDQLTAVTDADPALGEQVAGLRNMEGILKWITGAQLTGVDLVQQDEYSYDFFVRRPVAGVRCHLIRRTDGGRRLGPQADGGRTARPAGGNRLGADVLATQSRAADSGPRRATDDRLFTGVLTMPPYLQRGTLPPKRHTAHRVSPGYKNEGIYYEEVITTAGFSRAYSIVYHLRPPTRVRTVEPAGEQRIELAPQPALRHHHIKTANIPATGDPITGRVPILTNADVTIWRCRPVAEQVELYRNAAADEIIFVHSGRGTVLTHFGLLPFKPFDYIVIPRCTTYQFSFDAGHRTDLLVIESAGHVGFPPRYLNPDGQFRMGAPFAERDLHGPTQLVTEDRGDEDSTILVKDGERLTRYVQANHPFDAVGWDGMVYPFTFNADDFEPITGTIHQPPPIHQTFETPGFVVCTFAPRLLDTHPDAIKVPYVHSNVESDEVLYYVRGNFGSRRGVEIGSFTLHPHGIPHGPHPGTIVASKDATRTDELAVMVDTFRPLVPTAAAMRMDDPKYPYSWLD